MKSLRRFGKKSSGGRYGAQKKKFLESDAPLAGQSDLLSRPLLETTGELPLTCDFHVAHSTSQDSTGDHSNEDRVMFQKNHIVWNLANLYTVGVLDGHGGPGASEVVSQALPEALSTRVMAGEPVVDAYTAAMAHMEAKLALLSRDSSMNAGTCLVSCTISGNYVWCANLGDCRAALVPLQLSSSRPETAPQVSSLIWLSRDHKASSIDEVQRIESAGGKIVDGCVAGLTPSRTLGDFDVKSCVQRDVISIVPEVRLHQLGNGTEKAQALLVCATDGVWDVVTGQDVCHLIDARTELLKPKACAASDSKEHVLQGIAEDLVQMSRARGSEDDSTAVVGWISVFPETEGGAAAPRDGSNKTSAKVLVSI